MRCRGLSLLPVHRRSRAADGRHRDARALQAASLQRTHPGDSHQQAADGAISGRVPSPDHAGSGADHGQGGGSPGDGPGGDTEAEPHRRDEFPYRGATGILYDEGSYLEALDGVVAQAGYASLREERRAASATAADGRPLIGVGLAVFSERTAYGTPVFGQRLMGITPGYETVHVRIDPSGGATVLAGTVSHGQGHATTLAQMVADRLSLTPTQVRVVQGDTDAVPYGWGTFASRSVVLSGDAATEAADRLVERLTRIAAHLLEAAPDDVVFEGGRFGVRGVPESGMSLTELARSVYHAPPPAPTGRRGRAG